jgi:NAD(P)-dependent dehydrogenase (short-subunit alcohol dehydrogenase family)
MLTAGQSKLASVLFTKKLASQLSDRQVFVNCVNPGDVATGLTLFDLSDLDMVRQLMASYSRIAAWIFDGIGPLFTFTPYKGALTSLYVATSTKIRMNDVRGKYFDPIAKIGEVHKFATDDARSEALWNLSELLLQDRGFPVPSV